MPIPQEFLWTIPEDQKILFVSDKLENKRKQFIHIFLYLFANISIISLFFIMIFLIDPISSMSEDYIIFMIGFLIVISIIFPLFIGFFWLWLGKEEKYFLITNSFFYIYAYTYEGKRQSVEKISFNSISRIDYSKNLMNQRGDYGNLDLIISKSNKFYSMFTLKNIPHFEEFQKFFESILYEYGEISPSSEKIKQNLPKEFHISAEKLAVLKKRIRNYLMYAILIPLVCGLLFYGLFFLPTGSILFPFTFLGYILFPFIGIFVPIGLIYDRKVMIKQSSSAESSLIVQRNLIYFEENNKIKEIPLNGNIFIKTLKWGKNLNGITLSPSYDTKDNFTFGPFEVEASQIYNFIFKYLLCWKSEQGLLYNKPYLESQIFRDEIKTVKTRQRIKYSNIPSQKESYYSFEPKSPNYLGHKTLSSHFKSDEKILFTYDPSPNVYLIDILILFIFIALLIGPTSLLYWFSIFTGIEMDQPILFVLLLLVIITDLTIIPIFFLNKLYVVYKKINRSKNLLYLFTNEKILVKDSLDYKSISWQNVNEIAKLKKLIEPKTYTIEIYSNNRKILEISYIPNENPLVEKIRYLHENISKYQNI